MECVFIGHTFRDESGCRMSYMYQKIGTQFTPICWMDLDHALDRGEAVSIRPTTKHETNYFEQELEKWKHDGLTSYSDTLKK
jgi:hypothetical protein